MTRATIAAALLCAGCGNYSTEDLEFLAALPQRGDLRAEVPADGNSGAATVCANGAAQVWLQAKPASDSWNAGIEMVIGLIDVVRRYPPTWRKDDQRGWGPFPDEHHPAVEIQVVMYRDYPEALNGRPRYRYAFQARPKDGTAPFADLITGAFEGPSSARGRGAVNLDFGEFWTLGMNGADTPHGTASILYDRSGDPVQIFFSLYQDGYATPLFRYAFRGWSDGSGRFGYRFRVPSNGYVFAGAASYRPDGAGKDLVTVTTPLGVLAGTVQQCWDPAACLQWVDDLANLSCDTSLTPSCSFGVDTNCLPGIPEEPGDPWIDIVLQP